MQEFEKWWKTQCPPEDPFIEANVREAYNQGYKDALEWILNNKVEDCFYDLHNWEDKTPENHKYIIPAEIVEKELNGE